ncbi:Smr/MutS family protein [Flavisphingomonas formosensis]|uniref:Smr/MutS family protein n=1 Tax=Flavisphingomonas formosensis TaxID=861534 RepID=UPI0012FCB7D4|nr:Smr/MutS family protein [Sphingomonas formosensis]
MAGRQLDPEEAMLWRRVIATVRPIEGNRSMHPSLPAAETPSAKTERATKPAPVSSPARRGEPASRPSPGETLDGGWDRRLRRGIVEPDATIDLHGHTLASAHAALDAGIARTLARGGRLILLVTGKPRPQQSEGPRRGAIRAAVGDWLAASRHVADIAAVRGAHPRHGGTGALYIVLRRRDRPA